MIRILLKNAVLLSVTSLAIASSYAADENVAQPGSANPVSLALQLPDDNKVNFRGVVSLDSVSVAHGGVVYGPGPALGIAGLLIHGLTVNAAKEAQKSGLQKTADQVLTPYQATLDSMRLDALMRESLQRMKTAGNKTAIAPGAKANHAWLIESVPVFSMTQDQKAIILDNAVAIHAPDSQGTVAYQNVIRIVAAPRSGDDMTAQWLANDSEKLKEESANLLAESLDIAVNETRKTVGGAAAPQKTLRYQEGGTEKMERGELLEELCNRVLIKTLRGWLMSVPGMNSARCSTAGTDAPPARVTAAAPAPVTVAPAKESVAAEVAPTK